MQGIRDNDHQARSVPSGSDQTPGRAAHNVGTNTHANTNTLVLCNAEPFGFGPAASLREVLPHLRQALRNVDHLSLHYVGSGHTLALHKCGPSGWDVVHDVDVYAEGGSQLLTLLCETLRPALFLTVSDATAASAALGTGVPVVIIDLLLWYWPEIPEPWHRAKQVLAPNFEGVHARVQDEALRNVVVVPPIAPSLTSQDTDLAKVSREGILVRFAQSIHSRRRSRGLRARDRPRGAPRGRVARYDTSGDCELELAHCSRSRDGAGAWKRSGEHRGSCGGTGFVAAHVVGLHDPRVGQPVRSVGLRAERIDVTTGNRQPRPADGFVETPRFTRLDHRLARARWGAAH